MAKVRKLFKFHKSTTDLSEWNKNDDKLLKAVERGEVEKVETLLNKKTLMPTKPGPKGLSVFHWAALSGQLAIIEIFLAHGVDINATDLLGHTALHLAAKYGWPQMVEKLLQLGVNKHARDSDHMTALHHACGSGHPACVRALLHQGGGANDKDKSGRTALFYCGQSGDVGMCKWLLDHGADPNVQDMLGRTALIFAAVKGHRDVCELLLKRGADPDCRDKDGLKAVEYAIRCDHDIKDLFDQAPARASWDVNAEPGASNDTDGTQSTLFNDIVRQFSGENSPVPKERKSKQVQSAALSSQASSHSGKTNKQSSETKGQTTEEAYKELEEEHEVLTEELRVLRIAHIKLKDKVEFLTDRSANKAPADYGKEDNEKIQAIENEMKKIQMLYSTEKDKNAELEHKVEKLQEKLRCESKTDSPGITDNWGDSDDELFGGPLDKRPNEKTNAEDEQLILLKSQILTLQQENDHLKEKLQTDSSPTSIPPEESINEKKEVTELSQANGQTEDLSELQKEKMDLLHEINKLKDEASVLRQTPLTHSVSMFSEGESGIHMNGERSRSPSDEDDLSQNGEAKLQEECRVLRETCKKMQTAYAALVEAGDKLQVEYDQQAKDKANLEEQLNEVIQDKEDLLRENDFLAADNLHEDLERLINELETLQETNKALEKEKNILQKRLEDSGSLSNSGDEDISQVCKEKDELKQRCQELEKSTTQLRQDHEIVIEEIQSIQERYGDLQTERDQLQQEVEIVQDELDKTTQQFELVQHEFGQLEQDYAELLADKGKLEQDLFESESNRGRDSPNQSLLQQSLDIEVLQQQHSILTEEKELLEVKVLELQSSNEELKKEVDGLRTQSGTKSDEHIVQVQPVPSSSEKDKQIRSLQVKISRLQQQVTEMERRHRDTVNTYRTHLVSAVQGHMDPDVQKALHHIIEIRSNEEFC